jgi:hypothetical protein
VILEDKRARRDANKTPKGGKRLLREALGCSVLLKDKMGDADKMPKGSKKLGVKSSSVKHCCRILPCFSRKRCVKH